MLGIFGPGNQRTMMTSLAAITAISVASPVYAQTRNFDVAAQSASQSLPIFAKQAGIQILANGNAVRGKRTNAVRGSMTVDRALRVLLSGTGLVTKKGTSSPGIVTVVAAQQSASPAPTVAAAPPPPVSNNVVSDSEIVVTAQKKSEALQDVPISVSAFTSKSLDEQKIEGGSELVRAVPNVSFSKTNFASYNFSIRGIGTKALSVSSDPAVAISFNNTPLLRNRLFEQEYFDVERVEVLRGPQGTLYGRNATGGVVNMIPKIAELGRLDANLKLETGNYGTMRASGTINVPLGDTLAIRAAGAWTSRDGYDFNTVTNRRVNGRDLWSTRISANWEPSDRFSASAIWEHFNENDDRSRTGKQLCHTDPGPSKVGAKDTSNLLLTRGQLSQGCLPGSLYEDEAYSTPNGFSLPYVAAAAQLIQFGLPKNFKPGARPITLINPNIDPYSGITQSRNLREIATTFDPTFKAKNDVFQLNLKFAVSETLDLFSQTSYTKDNYFSTQDYNRFNAGPAFQNSIGAVDVFNKPYTNPGIAPGGIYNDPQFGPSNTILGLDMVDSKSDQWYQEFRLQSSFDGPLNFSLGANYLKFDIDENYYVFNNLFSALAQGVFAKGNAGGTILDCSLPANGGCVYTDPNPIGSINGQGHNYFRSRNLSSTESYAGFGEMYWNVTDNLKITGGLRYTMDKKVATPVKSQLLLATGLIGGGYTGIGYPESPDIVQKWNRLTGRFVVDWAPSLSFTRDTLLYASYARGYKGGGANPPGIDANPASLQFFPQPTTFRPETVNAFEIGTKNTLAGGAITLNANAFFYNYKDYQVSQIVDRQALNENYDANIWGAELEFTWRPAPRLKVNANLGYLGTRIAKGEQSIDVMNRTQGNDDWMVIKPVPQLASNCIAPKAVVEKVVNSFIFTNENALSYIGPLCGGSYLGNYKPGGLNSLLTGVVYDPATDAPNQGRGFYADLGGNELPNAPHWTFNIGAQYTLPIGEWGFTLRGDYYRQDKSWARAYNTVNDRLKAWDNANLSLTVDRPESGLAFQLYVKNVFNKTPITDAFINSDDSGLTTNVFTLDPRIIGFSIMKNF